MLSKEEIKRYNRHLILPGFGKEKQEKLKQAKVLVIGAGGLGCPVLQYLAAAGVGTIGIVDFDIVESSNLQRQILYGTDDIGKSKAEMAALKISRQNPFVKTHAYVVRLENKNALDIFPEYDVIIDGTDNFATRYLVNDACVLMNKPLVYGSIYKFEGQVSVFNYTDLSGNTGPSYRCLFPEPPPLGSVQNCAEVGVLGILPGIIGILQATEAIKIITGIGIPLSGKLLLFNALSMSSTIIEIERSNAWINVAPKNRAEFLQMDYQYFCGNKAVENIIKSITAIELRKMINNKHEIQLLDVRERNEQPEINELADLQIPLNNITAQSSLISRNKKVIVFCRSGARSKLAIQMLEKDFGFTNLYNLEGGVLSWASQA